VVYIKDTRNWQQGYALEVLHNICNMGTHDLPDMYARTPWAAPSGFRHTYQAVPMLQL